jgi:hypothetical protein
MLRRVALVRSDISVEHSASFIRVTRIGELLGTTDARYEEANVVPSSPILLTLMKEDFFAAYVGC